MAGGADGPGLHLPFTKHGVDQRSHHVDGSSNVKHALPFFKGVLGMFSTANRGLNRKCRFADYSGTNSEIKQEPLVDILPLFQSAVAAVSTLKNSSNGN